MPIVLRAAWFRAAGIKTWMLLLLPAPGACMFILWMAGSCVHFSENDTACVALTHCHRLVLSSSRYRKHKQTGGRQIYL